MPVPSLAWRLTNALALKLLYASSKFKVNSIQMNGNERKILSCLAKFVIPSLHAFSFTLTHKEVHIFMKKILNGSVQPFTIWLRVKLVINLSAVRYFIVFYRQTVCVMKSAAISSSQTRDYSISLVLSTIMAALKRAPHFLIVVHRPLFAAGMSWNSI